MKYFALVFALAITASLTHQVGDAQACIGDVSQIIEHVPQVVSAIKSKNIGQILEQVGDIVPLFEAAVKDCRNFKSLKERLEATPFPNDLQKCLTDVANFVPIIEKAIDDINNGDIIAIIGDIESIYNEAQTISVDCAEIFSIQRAITEEKSKSIPVNCIVDLVALVRLVEKTIIDLSADNFVGLLRDIPLLVKDVKKIATDCKNIQEVLEYQQSIGNSSQCVNDLVNLVPLINITIHDVETGYISAIISDFEKLFYVAQDISHDCFKGKKREKTFIIQNNAACTKDFVQLREKVIAAVEASNTGDIINLMLAVQEGLIVSKQLRQDCSI
eukprot:TRINITY_DN4544_c0_g2_i2.p1 TRINITY_DN4544_c0_g2~~TRINITY_DN4544_c0_g2_i2.p1  ORF type:complete len:330 (-),score=100.77 TRINITY_DN4544_c0_g2_i2:166-1155(-)